MNRRLQRILAGGAALAGIYFISRVLGGKVRNIVPDDISSAADEKRLPHSMETVEAASEDSFPASDPTSDDFVMVPSASGPSLRPGIRCSGGADG